MNAPAEIQVPRELLRGMLYAQCNDIYKCAERMADDNFVGSLHEPCYSRDNETVTAMIPALQVRVTITHAIDTGAPMPLAIVRKYVEPAIAFYDDEADPEEPQIRRDLTAWAVEHGLIEREAVAS